MLYDAVIVPDGAELAGALELDALAIEFLRQQYRHGKPILAIGSGVELLVSAGLPQVLPDGAADPGLIRADSGAPEPALALFKAALARHRVYARETYPARV